VCHFAFSLSFKVSAERVPGWKNISPKFWSVQALRQKILRAPDIPYYMMAQE
jgi:hypothetical protein